MTITAFPAAAFAGRRALTVAAVLLASLTAGPCAGLAQPAAPDGAPPPRGGPLAGPDENFPMMMPPFSPTDGPRGRDGLDVTTDSAVYCDRLITRLDGYIHPPRIVQELRDEGATMCRDGHVHAGIGRLRRALLAAREGGG